MRQHKNLTSHVNAQAFAHGNDIYFNSGKFSPHSTEGGTLLAHELTHTIQQGASKSHPAGVNPKTAVLRKNNLHKKAGNITSLQARTNWVLKTAAEKTTAGTDEMNIAKKEEHIKTEKKLAEPAPASPTIQLSKLVVDSKGVLNTVKPVQRATRENNIQPKEEQQKRRRR